MEQKKIWVYRGANGGTIKVESVNEPLSLLFLPNCVSNCFGNKECTRVFPTFVFSSVAAYDATDQELEECYKKAIRFCENCNYWCCPCGHYNTHGDVVKKE
jgi:hypothetical protein